MAPDLTAAPEPSADSAAAPGLQVALLGAGGYGTALLRPLIDNGHALRLWDRRAGLLEETGRLGYNPRYPYLRDLDLAGRVALVPDLAEAVADADAVVCAVSIAGLGDVYRALSRVWPADRPLTLIGISKGITPEGRLPDEIAAAAFADAAAEPSAPSPAGGRPRYVHLAGPAFAQDLILRAPVGLVAASESAEAVATCRALFGSRYVWVYATDDVRGVEAAAAVRTVLSFVFGGIAAASGMARSTKAFIFSRAQAEIARFGRAMGGRPETFAMDSPCAPETLGDLYLCDDPGSRNWQLGYKIASGMPVAQALAQLEGVAESVTNAAAVHRLAAAFRERDPSWSLPWCEGVYRICHEGATVADVIADIRARADRLRSTGLSGDRIEWRPD